MVASAPVGAAIHPEGTRAEQESSAKGLVRVQVLDKVEGKRRIMALPLGVTTPLPDTIHRIRVTRFTRDFALAEPPTEKAPEGKEQDGEKPSADKVPAGDGKSPEKMSGEPVKPVPRQDGDNNPAALLQLYRGDQLVGESWIFQRAGYLFQPSNMRYTFRLLGVAEDAEDSKSARSSAG